MDLREAEAVGMLRSHVEAWDTFINYIDRLFKFEQNKCVSTGLDKVQIHQGRARAFEEILNIEEEAEAIYQSNKKKKGG
jgi:hypothetical protein